MWYLAIRSGFSAIATIHAGGVISRTMDDEFRWKGSIESDLPLASDFRRSWNRVSHRLDNDGEGDRAGIEFRYILDCL